VSREVHITHWDSQFLVESQAALACLPSIILIETQNPYYVGIVVKKMLPSSNSFCINSKKTFFRPTVGQYLKQTMDGKNETGSAFVSKVHNVYIKTSS